jgi:hypothetical protein
MQFQLQTAAQDAFDSGRTLICPVNRLLALGA